jgi:hypothetical protein
VSGEAGASITGERYEIFVGSGINVSVDSRSTDVGAWFERESAPYREWLERARPALDQLFAKSKLPLVPLSETFEQVDGAIIEPTDRSADHFRRYWNKKPLKLFLHGRLGGLKSLRVNVMVSERVRRGDLDSLLAKVVRVLTLSM